MKFKVGKHAVTLRIAIYEVTNLKSPSEAMKSE